MASLGDIFVNLRANTAQFSRSMGQARGSTVSLNSQLAKLGVTLGAGFGLLKAAKFLLDTNREFERLNAQLITVTGSQDAATAAFQRLEKFAAETPFQIEENVQAFVRLRALGIEPTNDMLRDFGNIASGMGRRITDFARAVQGAVTGETEALKSFGIVSRIAGDEISFTFQGVTRTVKRNTNEIVAALQSIGAANFAGAMANEMNTLNGILSNLQDNLGTLARAAGEAFLPVLKDLAANVRDLAGFFAENRTAVANWTRVILTAAEVSVRAQLAIVRGFFNMLSITARILTALGKHVADVFGGVGKLLVGVATLDFQMVHDAVRETAQGMAANFSGAAQGIAQDVRDIIGGFGDYIGALGRLKDATSDALAGTGEIIAETLGGALVDASNQAGEALTTAAQHAKELDSAADLLFARVDAGLISFEQFRTALDDLGPAMLALRDSGQLTGDELAAFIKTVEQVKQKAAELAGESLNVSATFKQNKKEIDGATAGLDAFFNLIEGRGLNALGALRGALRGLLMSGGNPVAGLLGALGGLFGEPAILRQPPGASVSFDFRGMPPAGNPIAASRDAQWLMFLKESARQATSQGFQFGRV